MHAASKPLPLCPRCDYTLDLTNPTSDHATCPECGASTPIAELLDPTFYALRRVRAVVRLFLGAQAVVILLAIAFNIASNSFVQRVQATGVCIAFLMASTFVACTVAFVRARRARADAALLILYGIIFPQCALIPAHLALFVAMTVIH